MDLIYVENLKNCDKMQLRIGFGGIRIHHVNNGFLEVSQHQDRMQRMRGVRECNSTARNSKNYYYLINNIIFRHSLYPR
jgi:hypothetical protein